MTMQGDLNKTVSDARVIERSWLTDHPQLACGITGLVCLIVGLALGLWL